MKASLLATISVYILLELSLLIFFFIFSTAENIGVLCLILQVKNDDLRRTVLNSVVGTLDVCVRHPLHGEKFPEVGYNCTFSMFFFSAAVFRSYI